MTTQTELATWLNGVPTGGPEGDGRYPLTYQDGSIHLVYCPAAQSLNPDFGEAQVEIFMEAAQQAAADAAASANTAGISKVAAAASAANASQSATQANDHRSLAFQWANAEPDVEVLPGQFSAKHWAAQVASSNESNGTTYTGSTLPVGAVPKHGDRWLHTGGAFLTFIEDGDSGQWAELGPAPYVASGGTLSAIDGGSY